MYRLDGYFSTPFIRNKNQTVAELKSLTPCFFLEKMETILTEEIYG
jgi:hypothetical protein